MGVKLHQAIHAFKVWCIMHSHSCLIDLEIRDIFIITGIDATNGTPTKLTASASHGTAVS